MYFISVRGGFRPVNQQTHLLKQVGCIFLSLSVKKMYDNLGFYIIVVVWFNAGGFGLGDCFFRFADLKCVFFVVCANLGIKKLS